MKVTGKTRIFKNEYNGKFNYTTSVSNKKADGTWENMYLTVQFKKDQETEGDIEITDGFLSFYKDKNGMPKVKLVVLEYTKVQEQDWSVSQEEYFDLPF